MTEMDRMHEQALRELAKDDNCQRVYRVATTGDLHYWLSTFTPEVVSGRRRHAVLDAWTVQRRVGLMRRELAVRQAELCTIAAHDAFETDDGEDVAGHVAEHLRVLRGE